MFNKKVYGQSTNNTCPFCGSIATTINEQSVPVCSLHKTEFLSDLKCSCGEYLDVRKSKYGIFFTCMNCGPVNFKKGLELNGYPLQSINSL